MRAFKYRHFGGNFDAVKLLEENQLYAASIAELNDVMEASFKDNLSEDVNTLCSIFGVDGNKVKQQWLGLKDKVKGAGIYSMAKSPSNYPCNPNMWGMYADQSRGFCIEYDVDKLMDSELLPISVSLLDVTYMASSPIISLRDIHDSTSLLTKLCGTKPQEWSHENEIRLVYDTSGIKSYSPAALKAVYLGVQIAEQDKELLLSSLQNKDVDVYQMKKEAGSYNLKPELICQILRNIENPLPQDLYEILQTNHNHAVENFFVWYKGTQIDKVTLTAFVKKFREMHATKPSNVYLFSQPIDKSLYIKYPLSFEEDELFEKNLIGQSSFGMDDVF